MGLLARDARGTWQGQGSSPDPHAIRSKSETLQYTTTLQQSVVSGHAQWARMVEGWFWSCGVGFLGVKGFGLRVGGWAPVSD